MLRSITDFTPRASAGTSDNILYGNTIQNINNEIYFYIALYTSNVTTNPFPSSNDIEEGISGNSYTEFSIIKLD